MRVISNESDPRSITARTLTIAIAEDEHFETFAGDQVRIPDVGRCIVEDVRPTNAPMPGLNRGERVLVLQVEVLET